VKKLMCLLLSLIMVLSLAGVSMASSGEAAAEPVNPNAVILKETTVFKDGLTLKEDNAYAAEDGFCVIMTVDGVTTAQKAGEYKGNVVLEVVPLTASNDGRSDYATKSLITKSAGKATVAESAVNGTIDDKGIASAEITADSPSISIVTVNSDEYEISDSSFHILQTGNHASGGNDFTGEGCAIAATGDTVLRVKNVDVVGDGVTRTSLFGGLSTRYEYPTVYVSDCNFTATGDAEGEDCAVWVLGLHGVVRTCQFCDYYDIYYLNTVIKSFGWACLSVDGTEDPYPEDLAELNAAYVEGKGYADASGEIMDLNEFAVAALGLTDEYLAQLAAVKTAEELEALPQTNDTSLYYFAGKNTLVGSELDITDMDVRTGYSSYSIGANINVYSDCVVNADYGNVEANEYASSAYVNGTEVNARKSIVMCHSNAGGITFCADSTLNAGEIAFLYKGTGDGYTQEALDENAASGGMMMSGATGSNLYVRNCKIDAPVLVTAMDSDDPGSLGGSSIDFDDSICTEKDTNFDVFAADNWHAATVLWTHGASYAYNEAVTAYFEDCTGETALTGNIFNCHQFTSKNLVLTLDNSELTGVISSGWCEHDVDGVDRYVAFGAENIVGENGLTYGARENLGKITCYAAETVNNGLIVTLKNGAVWNVTETSYVSVLNVDESSKVNGTVTVLDSGIIKVEPLAGAASAGGASEAAYQEYLHEWLKAEDAGNDTMTEDIVENEFMPLIYAGDYETFPAEMLWNGMLNNGSPLTFEEWAAQQGGAAAPAAAGGIMPGTYEKDGNVLVIADDLSFKMEKNGENMDGAGFQLTVVGTAQSGEFVVTGLFDGDLDLTALATEDQIAGDLATVIATYGG